MMYQLIHPCLLISYTPQSRFTFTGGSLKDLSVYQLPGKNTTHHFCATCGSNVIVRNEEYHEVAVNVRAVYGVDVGALNFTQFDGRNKL